MAAMETLIDTVIGASLCGQQKIWKHVGFPEISSEKEKERVGKEDLARDFLDTVKPHYEIKGVLKTLFCFHCDTQPALQAPSLKFKNSWVTDEL